jgi:hypothetical protein
VKIAKNERDPPLFIGKLLIKFQNILRIMIVGVISVGVMTVGVLSVEVMTLSRIFWAVVIVLWVDLQLHIPVVRDKSL